MLLRSHGPSTRVLLLWVLALVAIAGLSAVAQATDTPTPGAFVRDVPLPSPDQMGPDVLWAVPGALTSPPPNPQIGDSWLWWLWVHFPMPPHWEQRMCTVRGKSDHAYVVVDNTQWNVTIDQADVDVILERWENSSIGPYPDQGIYEIDSAAFGTPPDELDNDPRVYLMYFEFGISADGFFFESDEYPEGTYPDMHSNECEVLYLNSDSPGGGPSSDYMIAVVAHEFQHMIHWKYDADELSWVTEGMGELAMWLYGHPDTISGFNSSPDNSLIDWPVPATWSDYIQTYLWSLYFYERYGGPPAVYDVVHQPLNSISGYDAVLDQYGYSEDFDDAFADWVVANYLDDTTIGDGRFGYVGADLPAFLIAQTFTSYPVPNTTRNVNHWAADYYRFSNVADLGSLRLGFDGSDSNRFAVWALSIHPSAPTEVRRMTIDLATQAGTLDVFGFTDPADYVILVVASIYTTGAPNPSRESVSLQLNWSAPQGAAATDLARVELFDVEGRLVRALAAEISGAGQAMAVWDGLGADGTPAAPGIYYARARVGELSVERRILRMP
jgi:hypothetical protein